MKREGEVPPYRASSAEKRIPETIDAANSFAVLSTHSAYQRVATQTLQPQHLFEELVDMVCPVLEERIMFLGRP